MTQVSVILIILISTCSVLSDDILSESDNFYIVTSPDNHCRREFTADEPCLTLQQYVYNPSLGSNASVSLTVESGTHLLQGAGVIFDSESDNDFDIPTSDFNMTGESARVVYDAFGVHYYSPIMSIRIARYVTVRGVTFISKNEGFIKIEHVQEVVLKHCSFQGIRLYLNNIKKAVISNSSFTDYSHQSYTYRSNHDYGAIFISNSVVSIVQSNFSANNGAVHYHSNDKNDQTLLAIVSCIFSNNTSDYGGSAILVNGPTTMLIQNSIFLFNTASGNGGAIHYNGESSSANLEIIASTFIYNCANFCGAISVEKYSKYIEINDSTFYYNSAVSIGGDGGAVCVRNASVSINNSSFVANTAIGDAGALQAEESSVMISSSVFSNNSAQRDGGALFTSAHPGNYTITGSVFAHNKAGDDGGAVFIGRKGSHLKVERSTLVDNLASDRGGAMALFGSTLDIKQSNIFNNLAHLGKAVSACNSFVGTFLPGKGDPDFPMCTIYDDNLSPSSAPPFQDESYSNITWLNNTVSSILAMNLITGNKPDNPPSNPTISSNTPESQKLRQTSVISYASIAISASLLIVLLLYITFSKFSCCKCKIRHKKGGYHLLSSFEDQPESDDEELLDPSK